MEAGTRAWEAHELAAEAALHIGEDPTLETAWQSVTQEVTLRSEPAGAEVWGKPYSDPQGEWRHLGTTPLEAIRFPTGSSRIKLELASHRTEYDLILNMPESRLRPDMEKFMKLPKQGPAIAILSVDA